MSLPKDFAVATPEEFVKRFGGDKIINKVSTYSPIQYFEIELHCMLWCMHQNSNSVTVNKECPVYESELFKSEFTCSKKVSNFEKTFGSILWKVIDFILMKGQTGGYSLTSTISHIMA